MSYDLIDMLSFLWLMMSLSSIQYFKVRPCD